MPIEKYVVFDVDSNSLVSDGNGRLFFNSESTARIVRDNAIDPTVRDARVLRAAEVA